MNTVVKNFIKIFFLLFLLVNFSCSAEKKKTIQKQKIIPLEILYKEAYDSFVSGNHNRAVEIFEKVEKDYSYSEWASKSLIMRSYIYYENLEYVKALTNLQLFKKRYAGNKNIAYAEYLIAMCLFEQINISSLSQENTELALKQFKKLIENYPKSDYAADAKLKIDLINQQFASKEMYLARYYAKREKWTAAIYRLNNIVKNYQTTVFIEEALHRLVEIHYRIGNIDEAKKYASILGYNYNTSDWYKKSYNIVESSNITLNSQKKFNLKDKLKQLIN